MPQDLQKCQYLRWLNKNQQNQNKIVCCLQINTRFLFFWKNMHLKLTVHDYALLLSDDNRLNFDFLRYSRKFLALTLLEVEENSLREFSNNSSMQLECDRSRGLLTNILYFFSKFLQVDVK